MIRRLWLQLTLYLWHLRLVWDCGVPLYYLIQATNDYRSILAYAIDREHPGPCEEATHYPIERLLTEWRRRWVPRPHWRRA